MIRSEICDVLEKQRRARTKKTASLLCWRPNVGVPRLRLTISVLLLFLSIPGVAFGQGINSSLVYVGTSEPQWGSNQDIGAQINVAYASCPATGCTVVLVPQMNGACYDYSVPIAFTTIGKYALLQGGGPTSTAAGVSAQQGGACLNYLPTTATSAITYDYVPPLGGGDAAAHGVRDITIQNNKCQTVGGCTSSAIGIQLGGNNSGAQNGEIANVKVSGFGTGISFLETGSQSWGMVLRGISIVTNTVGISFAGSLENISIFGGRVIGNGIGLSFIGNADVFAHGVSIDSNVTAGVSATSGLFSCTNCHWENESGGAPLNTHYFVGSGAASLVIEGGKAEDDNSSGQTDFWFSNAGVSTYIHGLLIYSPGRKATQVVQSINPCTFWIAIYNDSPSVLTTLTGGPSQQGVVFPNDFASGVSSVQAQFMIPSFGTAFTSQNVSLSAGWGAGSFANFTFGTTQRFSFVAHSGTSGQSLDPSIGVAFPTTWPITPFYICKVVSATGAATMPLTGEATATTTGMTLTFNGTPAAGASYQIQCVGE